MSGEPPEGFAPPTAPTLASPAGDGEPRTVRMPPTARDGEPQTGHPVGRPSAPADERLPELEGPPEIHRFLSPLPAPPRPSEPPPSSGGTTRRRSRRTVKVPTEPSAVAAEAPPPAVEAPRAEAPRPAIPPAPPVPVHRVAPTLPAVPRPAPKAPPSVPAPDGGARREAPPPPPPVPAVASAEASVTDGGSAPRPSAQEDVFEVIRPMRIISIEASPPSVRATPPPPPVAAKAPEPATAPPAQFTATPPASVLEEAPALRPSRPPLLASPELDGMVSPPVPKPPKPPVVEEVEAVEAVDEPDAPATDVSPSPLESKPAAGEEVPRGARTDEIEPIVVDEVDDRISDFDVAVTGEMAAIEVPVDLDETPKPKKPPPPPPKRQLSTEMAAVVPVAPVAPPPPPPPPPVRPAQAEGPTSAPAPSAPPPSTPAAPPPVVVNAAPPAAAAAPAASVPTLDLSSKKRQKPWWEEIFGDDFIRTLEKVEPRVIRKECDFIEDRLGLEKGAVMLDLACGSGDHAVELASRGYNVVGYDLSLAMLARAQDEAQERGQKINFLQGDMREMAFEEAFDGMFSWSTSFGYFDDEKNVNVLSRVHRGLRQGGMFLLDVINRDYVCPRQPSLVWFEGDGCVCMDEMHVDFFTSRLRVKRTVMFEDGRSRECDYGIRLYGLHELGKMLHDTGFKVVEVTGHPAHPGVFFGSESPRIIILAERG